MPLLPPPSPRPAVPPTSRVTAELAMHLIDKVYKSLEAAPVTEEDGVAAVSALPAPMIHNNWETQGERCFIGPMFLSSILAKGGFEWINEAPDSARPKWGFVATAPGSKLKMMVGQGGVGHWACVIVSCSHPLVPAVVIPYSGQGDGGKRVCG